MYKGGGGSHKSLGSGSEGGQQWRQHEYDSIYPNTKHHSLSLSLKCRVPIIPGKDPNALYPVYNGNIPCLQNFAGNFHLFTFQVLLSVKAPCQVADLRLSWANWSRAAARERKQNQKPCRKTKVVAMTSQTKRNSINLWALLKSTSDCEWLFEQLRMAKRSKISEFISEMIFFFSLEEHFRDACQQGDLETVKRVLSGFSYKETHLLLHSQSSCTGTPLFDAVISNVSLCH